MYNHSMPEHPHLLDQRLAAIQHRVHDLYQAKDYKTAYEIMTDAEPRFPEELVEIRYWRACLAACRGEMDLALHVLEDTVSEGSWYSVQQLREEQDLAGLQGKPRYEQLCANCLERQKAAEAAAKPVLRILEPPLEPTPADRRIPLMLALHGNAQTADHALRSWRPMLDHGYLLAAPFSSQVAWDDRRNWTDLERGSVEVSSLIGELHDQYRLDPDRSVIGGFSMGAGLALLIALQDSATLFRNFILVGPYLPDPDSLDTLIESRRSKGLRGIIVVGDLDEPCLTIAKRIHGKMDLPGYAVNLEVKPGLAHDFPLDFHAVVGRALELFASANGSP